MSPTFLRTWYPDAGRLSGGRRIFQVDEDCGPAGGREALQVVQVRRLLKLAPTRQARSEESRRQEAPTI